MGSGVERSPEDARELKVGGVAEWCGSVEGGARKGGKRYGSGDVGRCEEAELGKASRTQAMS